MLGDEGESVNRGVTRQGAPCEQRDRVLDPERLQGEDVLPGELENPPARDDDAQERCLPEELQELWATLDKVLEVVEDEEKLAAGKPARKCPRGILVAALRDTERASDRADDQARIGERCQLDEGGAVGEQAAGPVGERHGDAALAAAAGPGDRHEPNVAPFDELLQGPELGLPADQRREQRRRIDARVSGREAPECDLLPQDRALEGSELGARLQSELIAKQVAKGSVLRERLRMAIGAIQGLHQQGTGTFAIGLRYRERAGLREDRLVIPALELGGEPLFDAQEPQLLEPAYLGRSELGLGYVDERRSAPEPQCTVQARHSQVLVTGGAGSHSFCRHRRERVGVEIGRIDRRCIAARAGLDRICSEATPELRDVDRQQVAG